MENGTPELPKAANFQGLESRNFSQEVKLKYDRIYFFLNLT